MDDKEQIAAASIAPAPKVRRPRTAKKTAPAAKPVTRGQAAAWGALGLALGNAITLALTKWMGLH